MFPQLQAVMKRSTFLLVRRSLRVFSTTPAETPTPKDNAGAINLKSSGTHKVNDLERKMLVWTGKYKSASDVPSYVTQDVMEKSRNKMRIRLANIMMLLTAIGCVVMVWSGKKAAERGETVQKMNLDWHKEYNEQKAAELEATKGSKSK